MAGAPRRAVKLRHAFAANAASHFLFGAALVVAPAWLPSVMGVSLEPLWGVRLLGVGLFGLGLAKWSAVASEHACAIAKALMMSNVVGCAVFLQATLQGSVSARGWIVVALCALQAGLYRASN